MSAELLVFGLFVAVSGAFVGLLAGLLGIGGGLVLVPVLFELMQQIGADEAASMRAAIATSLATVIVTGTRSAAGHYARGALDWRVVSNWTLPIMTGALIGAEVASRVDTTVLVTFFAVMTMVLAVQMMVDLPERRFANRFEASLRAVAGSAVGFVSAMMGVGVAGLGVPLMAIFGVEVRKAVAAAALLGAIAAATASVRFSIASAETGVAPPWSLGHVNFLGLALLVPTALIMTPIGVKLSHRYSQQWLKRVFAAFLIVNAVRMLVYS